MSKRRRIANNELKECLLSRSFTNWSQVSTLIHTRPYEARDEEVLSIAISIQNPSLPHFVAEQLLNHIDIRVACSNGFDYLKLLSENVHLSEETCCELLKKRDGGRPSSLDRLVSYAISAAQSRRNINFLRAVMKTRPEVLEFRGFPRRNGMLHMIMERGWNEVCETVLRCAHPYPQTASFKALFLSNQSGITPFDLLCEYLQSFQYFVSFLRNNGYLTEKISGEFASHLLCAAAKHDLKDLCRDVIDIVQWDRGEYTSVLQICAKNDYHAKGDNYLPEQYYPDIGAIKFLVREGLQRNLLQNGKTHCFLGQYLPIESPLDLALGRLIIFHHHDEVKSLFWRTIQMCFDFVGVAETTKHLILLCSKMGASTSLSAPLVNFGCIVKQYREEIQNLPTRDLFEILRVLSHSNSSHNHVCYYQKFTEICSTDSHCLEKLMCPETGRNFLHQAIAFGMNWDALQSIVDANGAAVTLNDSITLLPPFLLQLVQTGSRSTLTESFELLRANPASLTMILRDDNMRANDKHGVTNIRYSKGLGSSA